MLNSKHKADIKLDFLLQNLDPDPVILRSDPQHQSSLASCNKNMDRTSRTLSMNRSGMNREVANYASSLELLPGLCFTINK